MNITYLLDDVTRFEFYIIDMVIKCLTLILSKLTCILKLFRAFENFLKFFSSDALKLYLTLVIGL